MKPVIYCKLGAQIMYVKKTEFLSEFLTENQ